MVKEQQRSYQRQGEIRIGKKCQYGARKDSKLEVPKRGKKGHDNARKNKKILEEPRISKKTQ